MSNVEHRWYLNSQRAPYISPQQLIFEIFVVTILDKTDLATSWRYGIDFKSTVEPLWKDQECLTKVVKFGPFPCTLPCTLLYKSCLFYPSLEATTFDRAPSWVTFIEGSTVWFLNSLFGIIAKALAVKQLSCECHRSSLMRSQHWFR